MANEQSMGSLFDLLNDTSHVVALGFVVFIALVFKPVGRMIVQGLDSRSEKIDKELDQAKKLKEEAQALLTEYQKNQQSALEKADEIISKAEENAKSMIDFAHKELEIAINKRIEIAMKKVENLEATALNEIREQAVEDAIKIVFDKIDDKIDSTVSDQLIATSIASMNKLN